MQNRDHIVFIFLIIAITLLVYYDSFNNGFVYDDYPFLVENPAVQTLDLKSTGRYFTDMSAVSSEERLAKDVWRPFMTLSFALDYRLWKLEPRYYHVENVLWHAANAILVYIVIALLIGDGFTAFIAAIVFAIHPVQTEAVTWVAGRSNVLFLFFFLLAFIAHIRWKSRALPLVFYAAALMAKEMAIVLPLTLILYDAHFTPRKSVKAYVEYYFPFFLVAAAYIVARFSVLGVVAQKVEWWAPGVMDNIFVTLKAVSEYIRLLVMPIGLHVEYMTEAPLITGTAVIPVALTLGSTAAAYLFFRRNKTVSFFILWFFVALVPVYNIVPFKAVMAERFLYLPIIGFAALFGMLFAALSNAKTRATAALVGASALTLVLIVYGALSIARNIEWRDEMSFYMQEAARSPKHPKAHYNLGYASAKEAARCAASDRAMAGAYYAMAIDEFKKTIALKPDSQVAYYALANAYNATGWYDLAILNFKKAAAIKEDADIYNNLGVAYYRKRMYDEALRSFRKALTLDSSHQNASINLGNAYFMKGEHDKAKEAWIRVIRRGDAPARLVETVKLMQRGDE